MVHIDERLITIKIENKEKIIYLLVSLLIIFVIYCIFDDNQEKLPIQKTYEVYAHNTIYLLTSIDKYLGEIQPIIESNIVSKENSNFIESQFNYIVKSAYDMDFPKPVDRNTSQIYSFVKKDFCPMLRNMNTSIKNEVKLSTESYKGLLQYSNCIKNLTFNNRILDINLNSNTLKSSTLSVSNEDIIEIVVKEIEKMKQFIDNPLI